jgi:MinD-like ATPase involved in chromosome partitioning or flagellar assembly
MAAVRSVVAIDADLRRPTLSDHLGVRQAIGLGDMAAFGYRDLLLQATQVQNLKLLPAGIPVARPADVISSTLPRVLEMLGGYSHTVIIDSPPLVGAAESAVLLGEAKWVVLVLSSSGGELGGLADAVQRINEAGGTLLGVVVNRVPRRKFRRDAYEPTVERRVPVVEMPANAASIPQPEVPGPVPTGER